MQTARENKNSLKLPTSRKNYAIDPYLKIHSKTINLFTVSELVGWSVSSQVRSKFQPIKNYLIASRFWRWKGKLLIGVESEVNEVQRCQHQSRLSINLTHQIYERSSDTTANPFLHELLPRYESNGPWMSSNVHNARIIFMRCHLIWIKSPYLRISLPLLRKKISETKKFRFLWVSQILHFDAFNWVLHSTHIEFPFFMRM